MSQTTLPLFINEDPENIDTEFKSGSQGRLPTDIDHTISAFSNTDGGRIILGVTPDGEDVSLSRHEVDKLQLDFVALCRNGFNVVIDPEIVNAGTKLIIYVPPASAQIRPVYIKRKGMHKGTFVRQGSADVLASDDALKRFSVAAKGGAETLVFEDIKYQDAFDLALVDQFIDGVNKVKDNVYQPFTREEVLIKQKAINKHGNPTMFGLLAFSSNSNLQEVVSPTINIGITHYPGSSKVNEDDLSETYLDNKEFSGNVKRQFDTAYSYIKTMLPVRGTIDANGKRRDYLIIPEVALREALANSIAHRDYSTHTSRVQIDVFSDRIEIINPGTSLVPIDQLDNAPSSTRNPLLMTFLKELGITDQKARGIRTIKISLKKAGLLEPTFENINDSFKITLFSTAFISNKDQVWLQQFKAFGLNKRQLNALAHVHNKPAGISNSEYRDINSMKNVRDDKKANKDLRQLVDHNILTPIGENKSRRYVINPRFVD